MVGTAAAGTVGVAVRLARAIGSSAGFSGWAVRSSAAPPTGAAVAAGRVLMVMGSPCRRSTPSSTLITLNVDVTQHAHRGPGRRPPRGQAGDGLRLRQPGDPEPHGGQ